MSKKENTNFKKRFAGKIESIDKKGGIEFMIGTASKPIREVDMLSGSISINPPSEIPFVNNQGDFTQMPQSRQSMQSSHVNSVMSHRKVVPPQSPGLISNPYGSILSHNEHMSSQGQLSRQSTRNMYS
jgi:hypothetical protein